MSINICDKKFILDSFIQNVGPYAQFIFTKNEKYFITESNSEFTNKYYNELSNKIRILWLKMNTIQKDNTWDTFQKLLLFANQFYNNDNVNNDNNNDKQKMIKAARKK